MKRIIKAKCRILRHIGIDVTDEIIHEMEKRTSEIQLDNYCRTLIDKYLFK